MNIVRSLITAGLLIAGMTFGLVGPLGHSTGIATHAGVPHSVADGSYPFPPI